MYLLKKINSWRWSREIDWKLLLFLLVFLNVKIILKVIAILVIYLLRPNFKFGFSIKKSPRLPLFYMLMIGIAVFNYILAGNFSDSGYNVVMLTGIGFWLLCILAIHQVKLSVETTSARIIHNTLVLFFIANAVWSFLNLGAIILETGSFNPYTYQGLHQKYFIGTGDWIKGITFDSSTTNALINAFAVVYFLTRSKFTYTLVCMAAMLLSASNFTVILLLGALLFTFIFRSDRNQNSIIVVCSFMLILFLGRVSPQNGTYLAVFFDKEPARPISAAKAKKDRMLLLEKPDSLLSPDQRKQKTAILYLDSVARIRLELANAGLTGKKPGTEEPFIKPTIPKDNIHTEPFQKNKDTSDLQKKLLAFAESNLTDFDTSLRDLKTRKEPGKLLALKQTIRFMKQHPRTILTGTGMGKFSSKLAFRASSLGIAGGYPSKFSYINEEFKNNHLRLYLEYFSKEMELHSLVNTPNSVYDQLLAEYGLAGILSFLIFYIGFFLRRWRKLTYTLPLLILLIGALGVEYWFEQLSIIIVLELLLFSDRKE